MRNYKNVILPRLRHTGTELNQPARYAAVYMLVRNGYLGPTAQSLCLKYLPHESRHKQICVYTGRALMLVARPYNPGPHLCCPAYVVLASDGRENI